jgi:uncharacterized membrane protein
MLKKVFNFYYQGFRNMPRYGRQLWTIIIIKLVIMFVVLKLFFFPNILKKDFDNDEERASHVLEQLIK